jgi:hypothetical protein
MKLRNTIKKIAALTTGTAMIGATMMGAMAQVDLQQYPAPFIQNGTFQGYFVVGETAMPADVISMTDIGMSLQAAAVVQTVVPLPGEYSQTIIAGGAKFASASQALHYGVGLDQSKSVFTDADLAVLRKTQVTTTDGVNFDIEFRVSSPDAAIEYGTDVNDLREPTLYVNFADAEIDMEIIFPRVLNIERLRGESITLFGREFVVSESGAETNQTEEKLTLYMATVDRTFEAGTTTTVTMPGTAQQFVVTVIGVNTDRESATMTINGETRQVSAGGSYTFGGERFYVKDVMGYTQPVGGGAVRLFIGSEKLVLQDGNPVTMGQNDDIIEGSNVAFSTSGSSTSRITITVDPARSEDRFEGLELGDEYVDPVFGALKLSFADAVPGLTDNSRDHVRLYPSGTDRMSLRFTNYNGQDYNVELLRGAGGSDVEYRYGTGNQIYVLEGAGGETELARGNRFILTNNEYSRILEVVSVTATAGNERLRVRDVASGGVTHEFSAPGSAGVMTFDGVTYDFTVDGTDEFTLDYEVDNVLITRNGAMIELPLPTLGVIDARDGASDAVFQFVEETPYNDGDPKTHGIVELTVEYDDAWSGRKIRVRNIDWTEETETDIDWSDMKSSDTNSDRQSALTPYGTYIVYDASDSISAVDLYYPRSQMHFNVFLAPSGATTVVGGGEGEIVSDRVNRINVGSVIMDTQAVNLIGQENMIVVGGPCVNTVAMRLMGTPEQCTEGFEVGRAWIKYFEHADGKVSLMVAGYSARDTTLAGQVLANYDRYQAQLQGKEVVVSGGSLSQVQITAPAQ